MGYAKSPQTQGEHLKAKRLQLGLRQKDVAQLLGVTQFTIINWEKDRTSPPDRCWPAIIRFLGYEPWGPAHTAADRLKAFRRRRGWSISNASDQLGVNEVTWAGWERGEPPRQERHRGLLQNLLGIPSPSGMVDQGLKTTAE